jgi:mediator of RNA polymerase II transcription subunit 6
MTAVHSLQASLNTLRAARPKFTPRTGFIWPIVESPSTKPDVDGARKRDDAGEPDSLPVKQRQKNNMLLLNAMRTTAAHTNSAAAPDWEQEMQAEASAAGGSIPGSAQASPPSGTPRGPSVAPTPAAIHADTQPGSSRRTSMVGDSTNPAGVVPGLPGQGKKKRKSRLIPFYGFSA